MSDDPARAPRALERAFEQLADTSEIGHKREDLTGRPLKF
jgi:plasmid stabilization system protein ParE